MAASPPEIAKNVLQSDVVSEGSKVILQRAAEGDAQDLCKLADMFFNGRGMPRDIEKAVELYQQAANKGYARAKCNLGVMYSRGLGVGKDEKHAFKLYEQAAELRDAQAQRNLGMMYEEGRVIPKDVKKAFDLYELAAAQGCPEAQCNLGLMYANGSGVTKDQKKSFGLIRQSAVLGCVEAKVNLGMMYEKGLGCDRDIQKACEWYKKALAAKTRAEARGHKLPISNSIFDKIMKTIKKQTQLQMTSSAGIDRKDMKDRNDAKEGIERLRLHRKTSSIQRDKEALFRLIISKSSSTHRVTLLEDPDHIELLLMILFEKLDLRESKANAETSTVDAQAVSFIHLMESFPASLAHDLKNRQFFLRNLGIIFTLDELEQDIETYLRLPMSAEQTCYLEQLSSNIELILKRWQQGTLQNTIAAKQLNEEATEILFELLWPNEMNLMLNDCRYDELAGEALKILQNYKRLDFESWLELGQTYIPLSALDKEALEQWLSDRLWEQWVLNSNDFPLEVNNKTILVQHLRSYQDAIIYRKIKEKSSKGNLPKQLEDRIKQKLSDATCTSSDKLPNPVKALCDKFIQDQGLLLSKVTKEMAEIGVQGTLLVTLMSGIQKKALDGILEQWGKNDLSADAERGMKMLIDSIPRDEILQAHELETVTKQAISEFIEDCKKAQKQCIDVKMCLGRGVIDPKALDPLNACFKSIILNHPMPTIAQRQKVCAQILEKWKKKAFSKNQQNIQEMLDNTLIQKWDEYRRRCMAAHPQMKIAKIREKLISIEHALSQESVVSPKQPNRLVPGKSEESLKVSVASQSPRQRFQEDEPGLSPSVGMPPLLFPKPALQQSPPPKPGQKAAQDTPALASPESQQESITLMGSSVVITEEEDVEQPSSSGKFLIVSSAKKTA